MVPSLHWLLLLWGLQGIWAQDYEEDYEEEEVVPPRRKSKQSSFNSVPQNGKCECNVASLCSVMAALQREWKSCRQHVAQQRCLKVHLD